MDNITDIEKEYEKNKPNIENNIFHKMYTFKNANRSGRLLKPEYRIRFHIEKYMPIELVDQLKDYLKNFKEVIETNHAKERRIERGTLPFKNFSLNNMTDDSVDWNEVRKNKKTFLYGNVSERYKAEIRLVEATYNPIEDKWLLLKVGMRMDNAMYHNHIVNNNEKKTKEKEMIDLMYIVKSVDENKKLMVITSWPIDTVDKEHDYTYEKSYHFGSELDALEFENRIRKQYKKSLTVAKIPPKLKEDYSNTKNNNIINKKELKNNRKRRRSVPTPYKRSKYKSSYDY